MLLTAAHYRKQFPIPQDQPIASPLQPWVVLTIDDADRPFSFETYAAVASMLRYHPPVDSATTLRVNRLPYGMWWQQLRSEVQLEVAGATREDGRLDDTTNTAGVWVSQHTWLAAGDHEYEKTIEEYRVAPWLT